MEIKKEEERLAQEQRKLAEEKAKEARLSESWGDAWDDDSVSILAEDKIREEIRRKNDEYNANQSSIVSKDAKIRIDSISAEEKARAKRNREDWAAFARGMSKNSQSNTSAGSPMQDIMRDLARFKKEQNDKEYADYQNNINNISNTPIPANPYMVDPYWVKPSPSKSDYSIIDNKKEQYAWCKVEVQWRAQTEGFEVWGSGLRHSWVVDAKSQYYYPHNSKKYPPFATRSDGSDSATIGILGWSKRSEKFKQACNAISTCDYNNNGCEELIKEVVFDLEMSPVMIPCKPGTGGRTGKSCILDKVSGGNKDPGYCSPSKRAYRYKNNIGGGERCPPKFSERLKAIKN